MKTSSKWVAVAAATIALTTWAWVTPIGAVTADPPIVEPSSVAPGDSFTVSGGYCDGIVTVVIAGLDLSDQVDGGTPPWHVSFTTPANATPGSYTIVSKCSYFDFPDTTVTVTGQATTTSSTPSAVPPAATHTTGSVVCTADHTYEITWTVTNESQTPVELLFAVTGPDNQRIDFSGVLEPGASKSVVTTVPGDTAGLRGFSVEAQYVNDPESAGPNGGQVSLDGTCVAPSVPAPAVQAQAAYTG